MLQSLDLKALCNLPGYFSINQACLKIYIYIVSGQKLHEHLELLPEYKTQGCLRNC